MRRLFAGLFTIVFVLSTYTGIVRSQHNSITIESIAFTGNTKISARNLLEISGISVQKNYDYSDFAQRLRKILTWYHENGFYFAEIDSINLENSIGDDKYAVYVAIKEGSIFKLGSVTITGASKKELKHISEFLPAHGSLYRQNIIEKIVVNITGYYENKGFPYISVNIDNLILNSSKTSKENHVDIGLAIIKNKYVEIDSIAVTGLEYTKERLIVRESRLDRGEIFNEEKIKRSKEYIEKLPFLSFVSDPELFELENGKSVVQFIVEERKSNRFSGLAGYVPSGPNGDGYLIGTFLMDLENVFGTGRAFQGEWQKLDRTSQNVRIFYKEPWVMGIPLSLSGQFEQLLQDSTYIKRTFSLGFQYQLNSALTAHASIGTEHVITEPGGFEGYNLLNSQSELWSVGISYDKRDYRLNPRKGVFYRTDVTQQNRKREATEELLEQKKVFDRKINAEFELIIPVRRNTVSFLRGVWNQTSSSGGGIPVSQQWYFGGAGSLRGYREKQFLASKVAWYNLELRYLNSRDSRIFLFWDGGFFQNQGEKFQKRFGYGFGLRIDSRMGLIGFDFGLGKDDTFSTAKLHFSLQNAF